MYTVPRVSGVGADGGWGVKGKSRLTSGQRDADRDIALLDGKMIHKEEQ